MAKSYLRSGVVLRGNTDDELVANTQRHRPRGPQDGDHSRTSARYGPH